MISKSREVFRQQIRRRQIEQKFTTRRKEILSRQSSPKKQAKTQFKKQFEILIHNIKESQLDHNCCNLLQSMQSLKKLIHSIPCSLRDFINNDQFQLIQEISKVFHFISLNQQLDGDFKVHIFQIGLVIVAEMTSFENLCDARIIDSLFVQSIVPFFEMKVRNGTTLVNLFRILGNILIDSQKLANCYTRLKIPSISIKIILKMDPKVQQRYLSQFIFLIKSYLQNVKSPQKFSQIQINICLVSCKQILNYYLNQNFYHNNIQQIIQDSLKIIKQLLNFQLIDCNNTNIDIIKILDLIPIRNFPINLKKQALFIIDSYVYLDKDDNVITLVKKDKLIIKLFSVQDQLRYISLNIFANLALYPQLKNYLLPHLQRIRLNLNFQPQRKQLYLFIFNYFTTQQFQVRKLDQQKIIKELWNTPQTTQQILQLQAKIWFGLIVNGYQDRPPLKILNAGHLTQVIGILSILQREDKISNYNQGIISQ